MSAVIFDLDGTLIDSAPDLHAAVNKMLAEASLGQITYAQTLRFVGNGAPKLVERALRAVGAPSNPDRHAQAVARFLAFYEADPATHTVLYPGVRAALELLSDLGVPLALCTNKPEAPARAICQLLDLDRYFPVIVGGDTLAVKKPDPAPLRAAMQGLGVSTCLYVGDSEVDAGTAQACGQPFALYSEGYRKSPVNEIAHDHLFDHFDQLGAIAKAALTTKAA